MPEKIVYAANSDECLDVSRGGSRSITGTTGKASIASERRQRRKMRPGRCSEKADTVWINRELDS